MGSFNRFACALATGALIAGTAHAATHRIATAAVPAAVLQHAAAHVGAPEPGRQIRLAIVLPMRNLSELKKLIAQIYDPNSPQYGHYLSVGEFADRFGATKFDYQKAITFFSGAGLQITGAGPNRYLIDAVGSVRDIERVFHVKMGLYQQPAENRVFYAPDREPTVDLDVPLLAVEGLDNVDVPKPRLVRSAGARGVTFSGSGPGGNFIPSDIRAAYYGQTALDGSGQTLGLMELEGYNLSDVQLMFKTFHQALKPNVVAISTDGRPTNCTGKCDDGEQTLDIEYAIGMAPNLKRVEVYVGGATSVLNAMANRNSSEQLSTSWGWNEHFSSNDALFLEMAAQGQSFLTASGDDKTLQASLPWPEEDANLTSVGGTDLVAGRAGGPWQSETGWADSASGPSLDKTIKIASYQLPFINAQNGGSKTLRNVSDISGDANFNNYICANGSCDGGWGGTSFASPIWAGFIALANQRAAQLGRGRIGFLNPPLYAIGTTRPNDFHDETSGTSGKYSAVPGYDLVTGLGSPRGNALIQNLAKSAPLAGH